MPEEVPVPDTPEVPDDLDLEALLRGGPFDRAMIERLKNVDLDELREALSKYLDRAEVERILARIDALTAQDSR